MLPQDPRIDPRLVADLDAAEADRLVAYKDTLGNWTIGRGHLLARGTDWTGYTIQQWESDSMFITDIVNAQRYASSLVEFTSCDTDCRKNALYELCFNMGQRWLTFKRTRAAWFAKQWQSAHDNLLDSEWATQVHETRANRIANYILTGAYPNGV